MSSPTLSVLMSVYNGQEFLSEAIESILAQTYRDFEFLIIDDGSTDGTAEILRKYGSEDERIRVHRHSNRGRAESLNVGLMLARGRTIARMDADDISLPKRLKEQVEFLEQHPEVGLLSGSFEIVTSDRRILGTGRPPQHDAEIRSALVQRNVMCHPAVMMRREQVQAAGAYRKALLDADDYDLWLRMSERTQLANLGAPLIQYRIHAKQVSIANAKHQVLCLIAARTAAAFRRKGKPDPLATVGKITPKLLRSWGVQKNEIREALVSSARYWRDLLADEHDDPQVVLAVLERFLQVADAGCTGRTELSSACLKAAKLCYGQGRYARALRHLLRGVTVRPIVAGPPLKRAFTKLSAALWNRNSATHGPGD